MDWISLLKINRTDDTTAFRERFISLFANKRVLDSNPIPGKDVREGIIDLKEILKDFFFIIASDQSCQELNPVLLKTRIKERIDIIEEYLF